MIFEKAREKAFWFYDRLKGAKIENHLKDITNILDTSGSKSKVEHYLSQLITHAVKTTEYYSNLDLDSDIQDFKIINKNIIRDDYDSFISINFNKELLHPVVTSGSTGTPFKVLQNQNKVQRNTADTIYFSKLAGYEIGQRLYYLKIWNQINKKNILTEYLQNVRSVDVMDQSDSFFKNFVQELNNDQTNKSFLGYTSAFEALCKYLDKTKIEKVSSNVQAIITIAEALNSYTKQSMEKYFDCEVISRYSNTENGILAQQKKGEDERFHLNKASYYFEILDLEENKPVKPGNPGRIVVTDLFNYGMPIIRYDTGDIGIFDINESGEHILSGIEGRKMDMIYDTKGELVSSFVITNNMWKYTDIKQYQFVQQSEKCYYFKINPKKEFNREEELILEFKQYFGEDAKIDVKYVSEIPLLSSGKRKKVVNEMKI